jgi:hypothetical protein
MIEVYHYEKWSTHVKGDEDSGLFTEYINTFLKTKQESSDWPAWAVSDEQREQYVQQYRDKEGIELEKDKITKNEGMRALSKLMLNSFWVGLLSCFSHVIVNSSHVQLLPNVYSYTGQTRPTLRNAQHKVLFVS